MDTQWHRNLDALSEQFTGTRPIGPREAAQRALEPSDDPRQDALDRLAARLIDQGAAVAPSRYGLRVLLAKDRPHLDRFEHDA